MQKREIKEIEMRSTLQRFYQTTQALMWYNMTSCKTYEETYFSKGKVDIFCGIGSYFYFYMAIVVALISALYYQNSVLSRHCGFINRATFW